MVSTGEKLERRQYQRSQKAANSCLELLYPFWSKAMHYEEKRIKRSVDPSTATNPTLLFFLLLILGLNILDSFFTMMIMDLGGMELNPIVRFFMKIHGDKFWIWKFVIVACCLVILCLHRGFKLIRTIVILISAVYLLIVLYQIFVVSHFVTPIWRFR